MKITLWKGYHDADQSLFTLVRQAWDQEELLILCPPLLTDFSFLSSLPAGDLSFQGSWTHGETAALVQISRRGQDLPFRPVLGVFTSGTMSDSPRLVLYSRDNVTASLKAVYGLFDHSCIQDIFCYPQAFHTFGLTLGFVAAHLFNWRLHTPGGKYQRASHQDRIALKREGVLTLGTPTHFFDLLQVLGTGDESLTPSYSCIMGGAGVSRSLWLAVQNRLMIEAPSIGYGCTEAAPGITHLPPGQIPTVDDEIGRPLASLNSDCTPDGIRISGPGLCKAIITAGRIEFPSSVVIRDRIENLGQGSWVYKGRLDLTLNRGGQKFSLETIEKRLQEHLKIGVVATPVKDPRFGEDLGLAFLEDPHRPATEVISLAKDVLKQEFALKWPGTHALFLPDFPLNESSKLDRRATKRMLDSIPELL